MSLLEISGLSVTLSTPSGRVAVLTDVWLEMEAGSVVGLVGESGGGKTMLARSIVRLLPRGAEVNGSLRFDGVEVSSMEGSRLQELRGRGVAMCFQQSSGALNPVRRVGAQIGDRLQAHDGLDKRAAAEGAIGLLDRVGIREPAKRARAYPHELSGGMRQRVMIALSLACRPRLLLADEPTTGLDVTLTRDILELLRAEATERNCAVLLVSHDIAAIAQVADRIAVLYSGTLVEQGPATEVLGAPCHPYTEALIDAVPDLWAGAGRPLPGRQPSFAEAPTSCPFGPRCTRRIEVCSSARPHLAHCGEDHSAACFVTAPEADMRAQPV
jgi:oligopeptide/dipeptide ABC transporter ATP-binding protein